jgi:hypothetical protein
VSSEIPAPAARAFQNRRALLWICQRYDLNPGDEPHSNESSFAEALVRYRTEANNVDRRLANLYWEAIWSQGARSALVSLIRESSESHGPDERRRVVILAGAADPEAKVSSQEFLPISVLPGLLDDRASADARYGSVKGRVRDRIAWRLTERLEQYPGRLLVVIGARNSDDVSFLFEWIEDSRVIDLSVLIVWPPGLGDAPSTPSRPGINWHLWPGTEEEFVTTLARSGAPSAAELPEWSVRVRDKTIALAAQDVRRIFERFTLLTERDLLPAVKFGMDDVEDFLQGSLDNWSAFGVGLPVKRSYVSEKNLTLVQEVGSALDLLQKKDSGWPTFVIKLPCEGGSGATTLLRSAAYEAASAGFPTLCLRPEQVDVDLDDVLAFSTALSDTCQKAGIEDVPPLVIVSDVEHEGIKNIPQLPQLLASHARKSLLVQAMAYSEPDHSGPEIRSRKMARLRPLQAEAKPGEAERCEKVFTDLVKRWGLSSIQVPSAPQWKAYEQATTWHQAVSDDSGSSLFWVALRFFLLEGMDFDEQERIADALGRWLQRRTRKVTDEAAKGILENVALLSSFRIVSPVWTVLRPVTGGNFSSTIVASLKQIEDVVTWGGAVEELNDQTLRFTHPALADEYLRTIGIRSFIDKAQHIKPMLSGLSPGHQADVWLAETFATSVLAPKYDERATENLDLRLELYSVIPPVLRDQSKTILHHWARCLYKSAELSALPDVEKQKRIELAIEKLKTAIRLPRRGSRDEHPSHLYNTLGSAYWRYARLLEGTGGSRIAAGKAWDEACVAFRQSIDLAGGMNIEALLAFSQRLIDHSRDDATATRTIEKRTNDLATALALLDDAEELWQESPTLDPQHEEFINRNRARALEALRVGAGAEYVQELQRNKNSDLGFYCEARLVLEDPDTNQGVTKALQILRMAEDQGVKLGARSLKLRLTLLRRHPVERFNFKFLRQVFQELENKPDYHPRPIDSYHHAVLCYQLEEYKEGAERFRRLRQQVLQLGNAPPRVHEVWRDRVNPNRVRLTHIRVTRITTEWRGEGYVDEIGQQVPMRPRHFSPVPRLNEIVECALRFEFRGPLAVPRRLAEATENRQ